MVPRGTIGSAEVFLSKQNKFTSNSPDNEITRNWFHSRNVLSVGKLLRVPLSHGEFINHDPRTLPNSLPRSGAPAAAAAKQSEVPSIPSPIQVLLLCATTLSGGCLMTLFNIFNTNSRAHTTIPSCAPPRRRHNSSATSSACAPCNAAARRYLLYYRANCFTCRLNTLPEVNRKQRDGTPSTSLSAFRFHCLVSRASAPRNYWKRSIYCY